MLQNETCRWLSLSVFRMGRKMKNCPAFFFYSSCLLRGLTFLGAFAKFLKATVTFVMSVRPSACNNSAPTGSIFIKLIFKDFSKICREYSSFMKIWQEYRLLYMKTNIHFLSYLVHFFLEWEMFQTKGVEKIKIHISCSINFFENRAVCEIMWKGQATDDNMTHCMLDT